MRKTLSFLLAFFCLTLSAQKMLSLDQVKSQWSTRTIKVSTPKPNILQLVQAFQNTFPTYTGRELIRFSKSSANYTDNDKVVDLKNGYACYWDDEPGSENDEQLQACVWNRSNGHRLFAVSLHHFVPDWLEVFCVYDFNPQTCTLTPEKTLVNFFTPSFPGFRYRIWLPRMGKNFDVEEFYGSLTIVHSYVWDGMKPSFKQTTIKEMDSYQSTFAENVFFADEHPLTQYSLIDVDRDGFPELWLSSADESYQAVFSVWPTNEYLGGQDDRRTLSFYKGAVCHAGQCGAGCMSTVYCTVRESSRKQYLIEQSEYDMQTDDFGPSTYMLDGEEISSTEGEKFVRGLGEEVVMKPKWRKLAR